jgi:dTDP-4-dehydrorhamnose reductase
VLSAADVAPRPELWGGIECTINRVADSWFSQLHRSGHVRRVDDLDRIAELGFRTLRYPVLWEHCTSHAAQPADFTWADERLARLRSLGVTPILGLMHHGSGPAHTSLIDQAFPELFSRYAGSVAARYPDVSWYTPINEPLTTARFCGLYGHWYPHGKDERTFTRALLNQCQATVLAMRAIRAVNPDAKLVQTDDLGKTYSTPRLRYQADFDNERRWIAWDLLCGRVGPEHPLWDFLVRSAGRSDVLSWLRDNPCPPDVIGINHYVTSSRYLDHAWSKYPACYWGGNGRDRFVDLEAVRVLQATPASWGELIHECWCRYHRPIALTEVHLGCTADEQVRWVHDAWVAAGAARATGIDVRAVTIWALLGSYNWNTLLTREGDYYETGAFDVRGGVPRTTRLGEFLRVLSRPNVALNHPYIGSPGWWRRPERILYEARASYGTE